MNTIYNLYERMPSWAKGTIATTLILATIGYFGVRGTNRRVAELENTVEYTGETVIDSTKQRILGLARFLESQEDSTRKQISGYRGDINKKVNEYNEEMKSYLSNKIDKVSNNVTELGQASKDTYDKIGNVEKLLRDELGTVVTVDLETKSIGIELGLIPDSLFNPDTTFFDHRDIEDSD